VIFLLFHTGKKMLVGASKGSVAEEGGGYKKISDGF